MSNRKIIFLSMLVMCAFAFGLLLFADDAEAVDGGGSTNVDYTEVYAGNYAGDIGTPDVFSFTYVAQDTFSGEGDGINPGIRFTLPSIDTATYPDWDPNGGHPWSSFVLTPSTADGYITVTDDDGLPWPGVTIVLSDLTDPNIGLITNRVATITFASTMPTPADYVVIIYNGVSQRNAEDDVFFRMESDEDGDGTYADTDDDMLNPNVDVLPTPSIGRKIVMTVKPDQTFAPNPYKSPTTWHDTDDIADKTVGVPFDVEFRLVDIYGNLVTGTEYSDGEHEIRIRGAEISPCDYIPIMTDVDLADREWYIDASSSSQANQQSIVEAFYGGQVWWDTDPNPFSETWEDQAPMTLYTVETNIELYSALYIPPAGPLSGIYKYEYETPSFNVVGISGSIDKTYGDPSIENQPNQGDHRITKDTPINLDGTGLTVGGEDVARIQWIINWDYDTGSYGSSTGWQDGELGKDLVLILADLEDDFPGISDDCRHQIGFRVKDVFCNDASEAHYQEFYVDSTAPDTSDIKVIGDPQYDDGSIIWVTMDTPFSFNTYPDPDLPEGVCQSGLDKIFYRIYLDGDTPPTTWTEYDGGYFYFQEECDHWLEWYGVDNLKNTEEINPQRHYVDITPPRSGYMFEADPAGGTYGDQIPTTDHDADFWIDYDTIVNLYCNDYGCEGGVGHTITYFGWRDTAGAWHPTSGSDNEFGMPVLYKQQLYWIYVYDDPATTDIDEETVITWDEDCFHDLEWFNVDALDNEETPHNFLELNVDGTPPRSSWYVSDHPDHDDIISDTWIDYDTWIYLDCIDYGCPTEYPVEGGVGTELTYWRYEWTDGVDSYSWPETGTPGRDGEIWAIYDGGPISWDRDCMHTIYFYNEDLLGNEEVQVQSKTFYVDGSDPVSYWDVDDTKYDIVETLDGTWIDYDTYVDLYCYDEGCDGGVGSYDTYYRVVWEEDIFDPVTGEYIRTDTHYDPETSAYQFGTFFYYLGTSNQVSLNFYDEECVHTIYWFNVDELGNTETEQWETFYVDGEAPESWTEIEGDSYEDTYEGIWIDWETELWFYCWDWGCPDEWGVGTEVTYYREWYDMNLDGYVDSGELMPDGPGTGVYEDGQGVFWYIKGTPDWTGWDDSMDYPEPGFKISWQEDCIHHIYYYNVDLLGNAEEVHHETYFVDGSAPTSSWDPMYGYYGDIWFGKSDEIWVDWETILYIDCVDTGCNPYDALHGGVGTDLTYYRYVWYEDPDEQYYYPLDDTDGEWMNPDTGVWYYIYDNQYGVNWYDEECVHELYFINVDHLGNIELESEPIVFYVDGTAPTSDIVIHDDHDAYPSIPIVEDTYWIDYGDYITLTCVDAGCDGTDDFLGVGSGNTYWRYEWEDAKYPSGSGNHQTYGDAYEIGDNWYWIYTGYEIYWTDDCMHTLYVWNYDLLYNKETEHSYTFYVDGTAPESTWDFSADPDKDDHYPPTSTGPYWIDHQTEIELFCEDKGCDLDEDPTYEGAGTLETYYRWVWMYYDEFDMLNTVSVPETSNYEFGGEYYYLGNPNDIQLSWQDDCVHILYYFNVDVLGNTEGVNSQRFNVDGTAPESGWEVLNGPIEENVRGTWVTSETLLNIYCDDVGCDGTLANEGVGTDLTYYRTEWTDEHGDPQVYPGDSGDYYDGTYYYMEYPYTSGFTWANDCIHMIYFFNVDHLGNVEEVDSQTFYVDNEAPTSSLVFDRTCRNGELGYFLAPGDEIEIQCFDNGCPDGDGVGTELTYYRWEWFDETGYPIDYFPYTGIIGPDGFYYALYEGPISWDYDCEHILYYFNVDLLGNEEYTLDDQERPVVNSMTFWVESVAPEITKTVGDPSEEEIRVTLQDGWWVTTSTPIYVSAEDLGCGGGSGIVSFGYGILFWRWDETDQQEGWYMDYYGTLDPEGDVIYFSEECMHKLILVAEDCLGYKTIDEEFFMVDDSAPGETEIFFDGEGEDCEDSFWITKDTVISLSTEDNGCLGGIGDHADETNGFDNVIIFKIWYNMVWTQQYMYLGPFTLDDDRFPDEIAQDCDHIIEYWAVDALDNEEEHRTIRFAVSNLAPDPFVTYPIAGYYFRPGYIMDLEFELVPHPGEEIDTYQFWISINGAEPIEVDDPWDTTNIPDPLCYLDETTVLVRVEVTNTHCRSGWSEWVEIYFCKRDNPKPCSQDIMIGDGWNLISIAVDLDSLLEGGQPADGTDVTSTFTYSASNLAAEINSQAFFDIVKYVVWYEKDTNQFHEYVVDNDVGYDFPIVRGEGYYVYAITFGDEIPFIIVGDCAQCQTVDLEVCWNLVGWNSMTSLDVWDFAERINELAAIQYQDEDIDVVQAIVKHNGGDSYTAWYPWDTDTWDMEVDHAYWIFVSLPVSGVYFDNQPPV